MDTACHRGWWAAWARSTGLKPYPPGLRELGVFFVFLFHLDGNFTVFYLYGHSAERTVASISQLMWLV